jgi:4-hydroxy-tetrahydrodipicolinate synthase
MGVETGFWLAQACAPTMKRAGFGRIVLVASPSSNGGGDPVAERRALELDRALHVLSTFDEGADLVLYYKHMMVLAGHPEYALHFIGTDALSASQRHYAETSWKRFKAWYAAWKPAGP